MLRTASARALALTGRRGTQVLRALVSRALTADTVIESHKAVRAYTQHKAWLESLTQQRCNGGGIRGFASRASSRLEDQHDDSDDYDADELLDEQLEDDGDDDDFEQVQGRDRKSTRLNSSHW